MDHFELMINLGFLDVVDLYESITMEHSDIYMYIT